MVMDLLSMLGRICFPLITALLMVYLIESSNGKRKADIKQSSVGDKYGEEVQIMCYVYGLAKPDNFTWQRRAFKEKLILRPSWTAIDPSDVVSVHAGVNISSTLYLKYFQPQDLGTYRCTLQQAGDFRMFQLKPSKFKPKLSTFSENGSRQMMFFGGTYYGVYGRSMSWMAASNFCRKANGELLSIQSQQVMSFFTFRMPKLRSRDGFWINLKKDEGAEAQWVDTGTKPIARYFPRPVDSSNGQRCYYLLKSNETLGSDCNVTRRGFICQNESTSVFTSPQIYPGTTYADSSGKSSSHTQTSPTPDGQQKKQKKNKLKGLLANANRDPVGSLNSLSSIYWNSSLEPDDEEVALAKQFFKKLNQELRRITLNDSASNIAKKVVSIGNKFVSGSFESAANKHEIVDSVNEIGMLLGSRSNQSFLSVSSGNMVMTVKMYQSENVTSIDLSGTTSDMSLQTITVNTTDIFNTSDEVWFVSVLVMKGNQSINQTARESSVLSDVLSFSVYVNTSKTSLPVLFTLQTDQVQSPTQQCNQSKSCSLNKKKCTYWDSFQSSWSDFGCTSVVDNTTYSTCLCNHTTNFAVLVQVVPFEVEESHRIALLWITYVGCGLSILALAVCITLLMWLDNLRSDRTAIHKFLMVTIILANMVFLLSSLARGNWVACTVVAVLLHHLWLSTFCWMMVEGFHLYSKVVKVFNTGTSQLKIYVPTSFGFPLIVVSITFVIDYRSYANADTCWLSIESGQIWGFVGPAIAVIIANTIILTMVIYIVVGAVTTNEEETKTKVQMKAAVKGFLILLPLLGLTWAFGILALNQSLIVFQYLFAVLNSLQGLFICLFHCILNHEVREALRRKRKKIKDSHELRSSGSNPYSIFIRAKKAIPQNAVNDSTAPASYVRRSSGNSIRIHPAREDSIHMDLKAGCDLKSPDNDSGRGASPSFEQDGCQRDTPTK